jgi:hypothetical protein
VHSRPGGSTANRWAAKVNMIDPIDYRNYYELEKYLFSEVTHHYERDGYLNAFDFFCIIVWKANRAKSKVARKLIKFNKGTLNETVKILTNEISNGKTSKDKLAILVEKWGFYLPIASAILTVLYPTEFTIYDSRVCDILQKYQELADEMKIDQIWNGYQAYMQSIIECEPKELNLRDKDRYLWGKSFYKQLNEDINNSFEKPK